MMGFLDSKDGTNDYDAAPRRRSNRRSLTYNERKVHQALRARGFSEEEATEHALDGISITTARSMPDRGLPENAVRLYDGSIVHIVVLDARQSTKFFVADYRDYNAYADDPWWCVHNGTLSHETIRIRINWLYRDEAREPTFLVFQAKNKTQIEDWLVAEFGCYREHQKIKQVPHRKDQEMATFGVGENPYESKRDRKIAAAQRRIESEQRRIDLLASLPDEPEDTEEETCVVWFQRTFHNNGPVYTYAAVKADGSWWTSGPQGGGVRRSWDDLVEWITESCNDYPTIYLATTYEPLN